MLGEDVLGGWGGGGRGLGVLKARLLAFCYLRVRCRLGSGVLLTVSLRILPNRCLDLALGCFGFRVGGELGFGFFRTLVFVGRWAIRY